MARTFFNAKNIPLNQGYIPAMKVQLFGDWEKTIKTLNRLSPAVKEASLVAQMKICKDVAKLVKGHLRNQDLNWEPLSERYQKKKRELGFDTGTLIAYGNYYNNIDAWQVGNQHLAYVGVRRGIYTKDLRGRRSRIDVATIAAIHEFSSGRIIPRRPLWNPTIAEMGGAPGIKTRYVMHLVGSLRVRGIPVKSFFNIFK